LAVVSWLIGSVAPLKGGNLRKWKDKSMSSSGLLVPSVASRRLFLSGLGKATLSATAVALIVGCESMASNQTAQSSMSDNPEEDAGILNVALGLEHQAIAAYQLGAESGLLQKPVLQTAVLFQSQHKEHRDALAGTIKKLGGTPVAAESMAAYAEQLNANSLENQTDVLTLAQGLEKGAVDAYLGVIPSFTERELAQVAGRIAADETMHWTVLTQALGQPLPQKALTFGA
jgi:rubrerythrin